MNLKVKIFADGADLTEMLVLALDPMIQGFTTNPTLMRKAGVRNYRAFADQILDVINDKPVSFEVFADDLGTMELQAREIATWGLNVYVKIPVMTTQGAFTGDLIRKLSSDGIR